MRKTKLVCTIGPSTSSMERMKKLIELGMNVARLNTSHGSLDEHRELILRLKALREHLKVPLAIMIDLEGPKIRLGRFPQEPVILSKGGKVVLTCENTAGNERVLPLQLDTLDFLKPGMGVLIDDGRVSLRVDRVLDSKHVEAVVQVGGEVSTHKGVNIPEADLPLPSLDEKDVEFLKLGVEEGAEYFALSFVRKPTDVMEARRVVSSLGGSSLIISKIETRQAMKNLEEIVSVSDGVMVARGDLGVELSVEEVPLAQKRIIELGNRYGIPAITATQMLDSMVHRPFPTRAEASDIANAVLDGTDAVMLSNETAVGEYPFEAVRVINRVAENVEPYLRIFKDELLSWLRRFSPVGGITDAISRASVEIAEELEARAIVTSTYSGFTARAVSRFRPKIPIVAITPNEVTYHRLSLIWGVIPVQVKDISNTDEMFAAAEQVSKSMGFVKKGDRIVITAGVPFGVSGKTNMIKVWEI